MIRVLCLSMWYPNDADPISGTFVHEQCKALREIGVDIRIIQPIAYAPFPIKYLKDSYLRLNSLPLKTNYDGFTVYHPRYVTLPRHCLFQHVGNWMYLGIRKTMLEVYREWNFDIVHAHTTYPCGFAADRFRDDILPVLQVVHTVHRMCVVEVPKYNHACKRQTASALKASDKIVFVSNEGRRLASECAGVDLTPKSYYITNGVNPELFALSDQDKGEVERLKAQYSKTWNLLFVGTVGKRKGILELLEAVRELHREGGLRMRLFLVGHNELGPFLQNYCTQYGLESVVVEVGPVLHAEVKLWLNFADAFILPSRSEGIPTVLFESLYAGLPSIFSNVGGIPDVVRDHEECLLIPPRAVAGIAQAIKELADNPSLGSRLGKAGRRLICENFTWKDNAERQKAVYEMMLRFGTRRQHLPRQLDAQSC